ncbi:hypothetical protein Q3G72_000658 [Acer saccharum]|nr:hypothetical protein Q3G72_000658 [Acer saccharum]
MCFVPKRSCISNALKLNCFQDFYKPDTTKVPRIFGMTASLVVGKGNVYGVGPVFKSLNLMLSFVIVIGQKENPDFEALHRHPQKRRLKKPNLLASDLPPSCQIKHSNLASCKIS